MIAKQTTAPLTVCVIASGLVPTALPAHAAIRPAVVAGGPAPARTYRVVNARPGTMPNVRSDAGQIIGPVGTPRASESSARAPVSTAGRRSRPPTAGPAGPRPTIYAGHQTVVSGSRP
jgi:hypothetical protein